MQDNGDVEIQAYGSCHADITHDGELCESLKK